MTVSAIDRGARWAGALIGVAAALSMLVAWRVPAGDGAAGLDLTVTVNPTGELQVTPTGPVLFANGLTPSTPSFAPSGRFVVRNRTGTALAIRMRALPSSLDGDDMVWFDLRVDGAPIYSGSLGRLRPWSARSFTLASGDSRSIVVLAWVPLGATGYGGAGETVSLEFSARPVAG